MKIKAYVTIVAPSVDGETIQIEPGQVGDVREDKAQEMIDEGYAEKAKKSDVVNAKLARKSKKVGKGTTTPKTTQATTKAGKGSKGSKTDKLLGGSARGRNADQDGDDGEYQPADFDGGEDD